MRVVVQRVTRARVTVGGELVSSIEHGLVCLCGITDTDTTKDLEWMCRKILSLRLWPSTDGKPWRESVVTRGFGILLVSQFTLYANCNAGTKPDFHRAKTNPPNKAEDLYAQFVGHCKEQYSPDKVKDGIFGAMMQVELVNDGPVTMELSTDELDNDNKAKPNPDSSKLKRKDPEAKRAMLEEKLKQIEDARAKEQAGETLNVDEQSILKAEKHIRAQMEKLSSN